MGEVTVLDESSLMVVASTICNHANREYIDYLGKKCESEEHYIVGAYEELCLLHNKVVRAHEAYVLQFNGDIPWFPNQDTVERFGREITEEFLENVILPNIELLGKDNPTVRVLQAVGGEQ